MSLIDEVCSGAARRCFVTDMGPEAFDFWRGVLAARAAGRRVISSKVCEVLQRDFSIAITSSTVRLHLRGQCTACKEKLDGRSG